MPDEFKIPRSTGGGRPARFRRGNRGPDLRTRTRAFHADTPLPVATSGHTPSVSKEAGEHINPAARHLHHPPAPVVR